MGPICTNIDEILTQMDEFETSISIVSEQISVVRCLYEKKNSSINLSWFNYLFFVDKEYCNGNITSKYYRMQKRDPTVFRSY